MVSGVVCCCILVWLDYVGVDIVEVCCCGCGIVVVIGGSIVGIVVVKMFSEIFDCVIVLEKDGLYCCCEGRLGVV